MKNFLVVFSLVFSTLILAKQVRPRVYTFPNYVRVVTRNTSDEGIRCSGFINARTATGRWESHFYNQTIYKGMTSYRNYYVRNFNDRYINSSSNISCYNF